MTNTMKYIVIGIAGIVVGLLFSAGTNSIGGVYSNVQKDFAEGVTVDGTVVIDGSGNIDAPITSTTGTFSSTLGVTGVSTFTEQVNVTETTGTSTTYISATAASVGGRIILEDHDGAGCSEIAILNGTVAAKTVTCP